MTILDLREKPGESLHDFPGPDPSHGLVLIGKEAEEDIVGFALAQEGAESDLSMRPPEQSEMILHEEDWKRQ